ncbi:MAG: YkoF family thiamine/hydroxymethylpyrimidine-binding protein [Bacteroidota bacterium]
MIISVEISFYPLNDQYLEPISNFIERIQTYKAFFVRVNGMSTQISGDYDEVMDVLKKEIKTSLKLPSSVFVIKILNADLRATEE